MVLTKTPICNFGEKPHSFSLKGVDDKIYKLEDCLGDKGTVIMFICNHCPYVKAIIKNIVDDTNNLRNFHSRVHLSNINFDNIHCSIINSIHFILVYKKN